MIAVPSPSIAFSIKDDGRDVSEDVSPCLRSMNAAESNANAGGQVAVAFCQNTRDEVRLFGGDGQSVGALGAQPGMKQQCFAAVPSVDGRSEEHTSELQSLMRISYAVFCLKKKTH